LLRGLPTAARIAALGSLEGADAEPKVWGRGGPIGGDPSNAPGLVVFGYFALKTVCVIFFVVCHKGSLFGCRFCVLVLVLCLLGFIPAGVLGSCLLDGDPNAPGRSWRSKPCLVFFFPVCHIGGLCLDCAGGCRASLAAGALCLFEPGFIPAAPRIVSASVLPHYCELK
jgi:hypothetical protein